MAGRAAPRRAALSMMLALGLAILVGAAAAAKVRPDAISGFWKSSLWPQEPAQVFACSNSASKYQVVCNGINVLPASRPYVAVLAAGYRTTYRGNVYSLFFDGPFGGNYTLVAYTNDMVVNYPPGMPAPKEMPANLTGMFVWTRVK